MNSAAEGPGQPGFRRRFLRHLPFFYDLKDQELQIIGFIIAPENRVIRCLRAELDLAEPATGAVGGLFQGLAEQVLLHEMRAGAGREEPAVFYKPHSAEVDLAVALDGILCDLPGLCEGGRVENDNIVLPACRL